ncbi:MAG TPA: hypothetical protein VGQ96_02895, partial [Candidatus Eremiobacteraceae bacterium]|nr:hypothetical protein [Candidatus Eremiobacteraceae bacterium]
EIFPRYWSTTMIVDKAGTKLRLFSKARQARIDRERQILKLRPWEFAPSEVDDGPSPYPPRCGAHDAWIQAQAWRRELLQLKKTKRGIEARKRAVAPHEK